MTENKLDYTELKETSPKAVEQLVLWVKSSLEAFQKIAMSQIDVKEDVKIPEITQEHAEGATQALLMSYFRTLYDFFDQNKIMISVDVIGGDGTWFYLLKDDKGLAEHPSRIAAEIAGFKRGFELLEEQL